MKKSKYKNSIPLILKIGEAYVLPDNKGEILIKDIYVENFYKDDFKIIIDFYWSIDNNNGQTSMNLEDFKKIYWRI